MNPLIQGNPRQLYALLLKAAADTLLTFGRDPRWIGGEIGVTLVLHTWSQNLGQHVHAHGLVTAGGLFNPQVPSAARSLAQYALCAAAQHIRRYSFCKGKAPKGLWIWGSLRGSRKRLKILKNNEMNFDCNFIITLEKRKIYI